MMYNNNTETISICEQVTACPNYNNYQTYGDTNSNGDAGDAADDATWILTSSFVILTMQSGFGLLEMGSSMPGHEVHIMVKNVTDVVLGSLAYWIAGYGISYGRGLNSFVGLSDFMPMAGYDTHESGIKFSKYIFQLSFAATTTTIVSGCIAMRTKFIVYMIFSMYSVITYGFVAHWVWADNGWLYNAGFHDFAGGGPVHLFGAMNGLIAIIMIGPRWGLFDGAREKSDFVPVSPSSQLFGLFMLWWGWIGFNCGSSFGVTDDKWVVATRAAIMTVNATAGGGLAAFIFTHVRHRGSLISVEDLVNGLLGSLVASSPTCACVNTGEAIVIGFVGAIVSNGLNCVVKRLKLDDPVGALGVHGGGGIWGLLAVGLFADSRLPGVDVRDGLFHGGGGTLLGLQVAGIFAVISWSVCTAVPFFFLIGICLSRNWRDPRTGLRVTIEEEIEGADKFLHGVENGADVFLNKNEMDTEEKSTSADDSGNTVGNTVGNTIAQTPRMTISSNNTSMRFNHRRQSGIFGLSKITSISQRRMDSIRSMSSHRSLSSNHSDCVDIDNRREVAPARCKDTNVLSHTTHGGLNNIEEAGEISTSFHRNTVADDKFVNV